MAKTFVTRALSFHFPSAAFLTWASDELPEAASQTFEAGSPVKFASGYVAVWVNPGDADIMGFAYEAGNNGSSAGDYNVKVIRALPGLALEANFLGSSAATNVLAAADLGTEAGLVHNANLLGTGSGGWYFEDGGTAAVIIQKFVAAPAMVTNTPNEAPAAGDSDARIRAYVKPGVSLWY